VDENLPTNEKCRLFQVQGIGVGSTIIDMKFEELVNKRLALHPEIAGQLSPNFAAELASSTKFRTVKHSFGSAAGNYDRYVFRDGIPPNLTHPGLKISGGRIEFSR
jgi:hypothetical protein